MNWLPKSVQVPIQPCLPLLSRSCLGSASDKLFAVLIGHVCLSRPDQAAHQVSRYGPLNQPIVCVVIGPLNRHITCACRSRTARSVAPNASKGWHQTVARYKVRCQLATLPATMAAMQLVAALNLPLCLSTAAHQPLKCAVTLCKAQHKQPLKCAAHTVQGSA